MMSCPQTVSSVVIVELMLQCGVQSADITAMAGKVGAVVATLVHAQAGAFTIHVHNL